MSDDEIENIDNWYDFGLSDYFDSEEGLSKFKDWLDVAIEGIRLLGIFGIEEESAIADLIKTIAASAAIRGYDYEE